MRYLKLCVSLLAFLVVVACGGNGIDNGAPGVNVTGTWSVTLQSTGGVTSLQLTQSGTSVTGTFDGIPSSGTFDGNTLSLSGSSGAVSYTATAQVVGDTMNGTLNVNNNGQMGSTAFTGTRAGGPAPNPNPNPNPNPDPNPDPNPGGDLTGGWQGTFTVDGSQVQFAMNLTQNGTSVTGTFNIDGDMFSLDGSINGNNFNATVGGLTITATVSGNTMSGTLSGEGNNGPFSYPFTASKL